MRQDAKEAVAMGVARLHVLHVWDDEGFFFELVIGAGLTDVLRKPASGSKPVDTWTWFSPPSVFYLKLGCFRGEV
ncbi:hypothetical protein MY11210_003123 [Beauveria gryllotalpidicola]